jgi:hypothetical protein
MFSGQVKSQCSGCMFGGKRDTCGSSRPRVSPGLPHRVIRGAIWTYPRPATDQLQTSSRAPPRTPISSCSDHHNHTHTRGRRQQAQSKCLVACSTPRRQLQTADRSAGRCCIVVKPNARWNLSPLATAASRRTAKSPRALFIRVWTTLPRSAVLSCPANAQQRQAEAGQNSCGKRGRRQTR